MFRIIAASLLICAASLRIPEASLNEKIPEDAMDIVSAGKGGYASYDDYVESQTSKTDIKLQQCKQHDPKARDGSPDFTADIKFLTTYLEETLHVPFANKFGLAHGTRCGFEQQDFMAALKHKDVKVLGTELSPEAAVFKDTIIMDFHEVKPEWEGKVDVVYSNALDHSPNPELALKAWMKEVSPDGALVIEHSKYSMKTDRKIDVFAGSVDTYKKLIESTGAKVVAILDSPNRADIKARFIVAQHA